MAKSGNNSKGNDKPHSQPQDAGTGRFVTKEYAEKHPKTTFTEAPKKDKKP